MYILDEIIYGIDSKSNFTTYNLHNGKLLFLKEHLNRLYDDAKELSLVIPMSKKTLKRLKDRAEGLEVKPTVLTRAIILEFLKIKNYVVGSVWYAQVSDILIAFRNIIRTSLGREADR